MNSSTHIRVPIVYVLVLSTLGFASCENNRYELQKDDSGRIIRLDKKTGDVVVIEGDKTVKVKSQKEQEAEERTTKAILTDLAKPKEWPSQEIPELGVFSTVMITSWREGLLYYQLSMSPVPEKFETSRSRSSFVVSFMDSSGFQIAMEDIDRAKVSKAVWDSDKGILLMVNSSIPCSAQIYKNISSWNLSWRF